MEKGIGEGDGEGGRECELKREGESDAGWGRGESIEEGGSWGGVTVGGEGSKAIGLEAKVLERSRGLSCRTDSIYLGRIFLLSCNTTLPTF